jgi:hypothetical protein
VAELSVTFITRRVLKMLTDGDHPLRLKLEWQAAAHEYLRQCLRLYKQNLQQDRESRLQQDRERIQNFYSFWRLLQILDNKEPARLSEEQLFSGCWPSEHDKPDDNATVVALQILSQQQQDDYIRDIRAYLCEKIKNLFAESSNLLPSVDRISKLACLVGCLADPIVLTMNEIQYLVQCIRSLPSVGRSRLEDIRHIIMLWQKAPEVAKTGKAEKIGNVLLNLIQHQRGDSYDLVFDLIYMYGESPEYCESVVSRLAGACVNFCGQTAAFHIVQSLAAPKQTKRIAETALDDVEQMCKKWQSKVPLPIRELPQGLRDEIASMFNNAHLENDHVQVTVTNQDGIRLWHLEQELVGKVCYEASAGGVFACDNGTMVVLKMPAIDSESKNGGGATSAVFWQYRMFRPWSLYLFVEVHFEINANLTRGGYQSNQLSVIPDSISKYRKVIDIFLSIPDSQKKRYTMQFCDQVTYGLLDACPSAPLLQRRLWISDMCLATWEEHQTKSKYLKVFKDIANIETLDRTKWKRALSDMCRSETPETAIKKYLYHVLYDLLAIFTDSSGTEEFRSSLTREKKKIPDDVHLVMSTCMAKEFFDHELIDVVLHRLLSDINKANNKVIIGRYEQYIDRGLWLANFFDESNISRKCAERMSLYHLLQPKHYCRMHAKIVLRLLHGDTYSHDELNQIKADIEQLFDRDTYHSQHDLPEPERTRVEAKKSHNLTVCQDVKAMLDSYKLVT